MSTCTDVDVPYLETFARHSTCKDSYSFEFGDMGGCGGSGRHRIGVFRSRALHGDRETTCRNEVCERASAAFVAHIHSPRPEYTTNLYHAMEEVYSLLQTSILVNVSLSDISLVFTGVVAEFRPHVRGVFEMVSGGVRVLPPASTLCPGYTVVPLRACRGSALPATWMPPRPCPHHELTRRLVGLFPLSRAPRADAAVMMTRRYARSRRLRNPNHVEQCLRTRIFRSTPSDGRSQCCKTRGFWSLLTARG